MRKLVLRWLCIGGSVLVVGPLVGAVVSSVRGVDGSGAATALVSSNPAWGVVAVLIGVALAGVAGVVAAVLVGARDGLFCAGTALGWGAWATGRLTEVARATDLENPLGRLAGEGLIVGAAAAAVGIAVVWVGGGEARDESDRMFGKQSLIGLAAMVVVGGVVAWGVARSGMVGQTFAAAATAGVFGGLAARVVGHGCSGRTLMISIPVLAFAGPLIANARIGGSFGEALYGNQIAGIGWLMPLDWASGMLLGIPLGLTWAASMVEHHQPEAGGGREAAVGRG